MTQIVGVCGRDKNSRYRREKSKHKRFLSFVHTIQIVCVCVCVCRCVCVCICACACVCVCVCVLVCVSLFHYFFPFFLSHTHFLSPPLPSANLVHGCIARQFHEIHEIGISRILENFSVLASREISWDANFMKFLEMQISLMYRAPISWSSRGFFRGDILPIPTTHTF